jgi:beta-lactamase superfamily II metal-dependent hydrolase
MFEIDFLSVGEGARSGDAIAMRFTRPDGDGRLAHVIIDAGFKPSGEKLIDHVEQTYGVDTVDLVVLTHPDGDHIGGMGVLLEGLRVGALAIHDLAANGGADLKAAQATTELIALAKRRGTGVYDAFQGLNAFGEALLVAGPSQSFYQALVAEEVAQERKGTRRQAYKSTLREAAERVFARALSRFPVETDFNDAGGTEARNNTSAIVDLRLGSHRFLFTGDAGVPALNEALDYLDARGRTDRYPDLIQIPHHGSRHNGSRELIAGIAGPHSGERRGVAYVSISEEAARDPRYPSPRITNAFGRRGYEVAATAGTSIFLVGDGATRNGAPLTVLPALDETIDDRP